MESRMRNQSPGWARYVVDGCTIFYGRFYASTLSAARAVRAYHGGVILPT